MKRREFLQTITAFGASAALQDFRVFAAVEPTVETSTLAPPKALFTFFVDSLGALSFENKEPWPNTRAEALGLSPVVDQAGLKTLADEAITFAQYSYRRHDIRQAFEGSNLPAWGTWLGTLDEPTLAVELEAANRWMNEEARGDDLELADILGFSERGAAQVFFDDKFPSGKPFGIRKIMGEHFEWGARAASLDMSIHNANAIAMSLDIPIRFKPKVRDTERFEQLAIESNLVNQDSSGTVTSPLRDTDEASASPSESVKHPLYHHPRIAAVRHAIRSISTSQAHKAALYHSLYSYASQIVTRPTYYSGEGHGDFEAIQQVTLEDRVARSMRMVFFQTHFE